MEGFTHKYEQQEAGIIKGYLRGCLLHFTLWHLKFTTLPQAKYSHPLPRTPKFPLKYKLKNLESYHLDQVQIWVKHLWCISFCKLLESSHFMEGNRDLKYLCSHTLGPGKALARSCGRPHKDLRPVMKLPGPRLG